MKEQLDRIENKLNELIELQNPIFSEVIEISIYDDDGLSFEMTEHGGVRIIEVDEYLKELKNSGDADKITVSNNQDSYFCFLSPNRTYTDYQHTQIRLNQKYNWYTDQKQGALNRYHERKGNKILSKIDNHATITNGNYSRAEHEKWHEKLRENILFLVKQKVIYELDHLHDNNPYK